MAGDLPFDLLSLKAIAEGGPLERDSDLCFGSIRSERSHDLGLEDTSSNPAS